MNKLWVMLLVVAVIVGLPRSRSVEADEGAVPEWGAAIDPDGDCRFRFEDDVLTMRFGQGPHGLDAESNRMNSPRVMCELNGDFSVTVTIEGDLPLPEEAATAYVSGGLLLMIDDENYIRMERASFTRGGQVWHYANFERRIDAKRTRMGRFADFPLRVDEPVEMRLEVKADLVRGLVRHEGDAWHELGTTTIDNREAVRAGVSGVKTSAQPAEVVFRDLEITPNDRPVDAATRSLISLDRPRLASPFLRPPPVDVKELLNRLQELRQRSQKIGEMSREEQEKLIADAKPLAAVKQERFSARFGPVTAKLLASQFVDAGQPQLAARVYREFADALERLRDPKIRSAINDLRAAADRLEDELGKAE